MKIIHKLKLPDIHNQAFVIGLPDDYIILDIQADGESTVLWYIFDTDTNTNVEATFYAAYTGREFNLPEESLYIKTVKLERPLNINNTFIILHYFQIIP